MNAAPSSSSADASRTKTFVKAEARVTSEFAQLKGGYGQWTYVGEDGIAGRNPGTGRNDDDLSVFLVPGQRAALVRQFPYVEIEKVAYDRKAHPERWVEDLYYGRSRNFIGSSSARERVNGAYVMVVTTWLKRLRRMAGVRREEVHERASNYVPAYPQATVAQIPDPVRRARVIDLHEGAPDGERQSELQPSLRDPDVPRRGEPVQRANPTISLHSRPFSVSGLQRRLDQRGREDAVLTR